MRHVFTFVAFLSLAPLSAMAEPSKDDVAKAIMLFKEGRALEKKGDALAACAKFEESQKLAPATGTQLNIAVCHAELGHYVQAYGELKIGIAKAIADKRADRKEVGEEWMKKVEAKIGFVTITRADPAVDVSVDGAPASFDVDTPIELGPHTIDAKSPGKKAWSTSLSWTVAEHKTVAVPALEADVAPVPIVTAAPTATTPPLAQTPHDDAPIAKDGVLATSTASWRAPLGIAGVAVGAVGFGLGAYLFIKSFSQRNRAEALVHSDVDAAVAENDRAKVSRTLGYVGLGAGAAIGAVGAWLYFTAKHDDSATHATATRLVPTVGLQGAGFALEGAF